MACGSGARRGGSRRRRCCGRSRSRRCDAGFRSVLGARVAVFAFGSAVSLFASAVAAVFLERPRPPRLPRRRLGLVLLDCPASSAGSVLTGSGASVGAAASLGASSADFLDRNQRKKNLLRARALQQRRLERRRGACAAGSGHGKTSAHRVPTAFLGAPDPFAHWKTNTLRRRCGLCPRRLPRSRSRTPSGLGPRVSRNVRAEKSSWLARSARRISRRLKEVDLG